MRRQRPANSYARRGPVKDAYDTVLVVTEGEKTEPNYLYGLRMAHRLSSANIRVTNAPGTDPMSIVQYTEQLMAEDDYDRVFSVFDRDRHPSFAPAIQRVANSVRGRAGTWQAIPSTPCFELWLILHYVYTAAPIVAAGQRSPGEMAVRALQVHLPDYAKGHKNIYEQVADKTEQAITHAKKLTKQNAAARASNPATDMHILVEYLRGLK